MENPKQSIHEERLAKFKSFLVYLGQLEYNIVNTEESLAAMKSEKTQLLTELKILENDIESIKEDESKIAT